MAIHIVIDGYNLIGGEKGLRGKGQSEKALEEGKKEEREAKKIMTVIVNRARVPGKFCLT